jgi:hypothetical protein
MNANEPAPPAACRPATEAYHTIMTEASEMSQASDQALTAWRRARKRAYRSWFAHIGLALLGTLWFINNYQRADAVSFAVFLMIPLLCIRGAWRADRAIRTCSAKLTELTRDAS